MCERIGLPNNVIVFLQGVRTKTVKKSARVLIEKYYSRLTLDFHVNKKLVAEVAIVPSKRMRNKIAGFVTHLMKRIQRGPVRGISLKLQEEERERRLDFVPEVRFIPWHMLIFTFFGCIFAAVTNFGFCSLFVVHVYRNPPSNRTLSSSTKTPRICLRAWGSRTCRALRPHPLYLEEEHKYSITLCNFSFK